jgi:hypothetical protein
MDWRRREGREKEFKNMKTTKRLTKDGTERE